MLLNEIDLVITDIEMPGMSGIEFADQLNRFQLNTPILFMSGAEASTLGEKAFVNGPIHFLPKPFDLRTLSEIVAGLMRPASHGASAAS